MEGTIAEVRMFGGNFAPRSWALCEGQLLAISQYQALFSILGTMYGGDGRTTFGLPDLRGRTPVGVGQGAGLTSIRQGARYGAETVTLTTAQIPAHNHTATSVANASGVPGTEVKPADKIWAASNTGDADFGEASASRPMSASAVTTSIGNTGGNGAHENRPPQLGINYIICLDGVYPSRS